MSYILQDFRLALRLLRKRPTSSLVVILTLALGIGANTTFFSSFYGMVLRPLPFESPDELVSLMASRPEEEVSWGQHISALDYRDAMKESNVFEEAGAYSWASYNLESGDAAERIPGAAVEASLFSTLGVTPQLGRSFTAQDDLPNGPNVVLISDALWQERYDRDPRVLGATLRIDDASWEIIGVMPDGFRFPNEGHLWTPLALDEATLQRDDRNYLVIARLNQGHDVVSAQTDLNTLAEELERLYPDTNRGWAFIVRDLHEHWLPPVTQLASVAQVVLVLGVMLIVCANIANLTLAQASVRQQEMALRAALGASRQRLARLTLAESMLLAAAGGLVGLLAAVWSEDWMASISPVTIPYWLDFGVDGPVLLFGLGVTVLAGFLVGLLPALKGTGQRLFEALRGGGRNEDPARGRLRQGLVVLEYAITVVVLVAGLLMTQSFDNVRGKDQGFAVDDRLTFRLALTSDTYDDMETRRTFYERLSAGLAELPRVHGVGSSTHLPISQLGAHITRLEVEGRDMEEQPGPRVVQEAISTGYLESLDIQLLAGRHFTSQEQRTGSPVMLISQTLADQLWPGEDALGRLLRPGVSSQAEADSLDAELSWFEVVGVVSDVEPGQLLAGLDTRPRFQTYVPSLHPSAAGLILSRVPTFVIAADGNLDTLAPAIRQQVQALDPAVPVFDLISMHDVLDRFYFAQKIWSQMFSAIAFLALVIAAVGAYGVTAYSVSQRFRELGIRLALGAERGPLLRLVMRQGVILAVTGVGIGLLIALPLATTMGNLLHDMQALDPGVFASVITLLLGVGVVASFGPAWRAVHLDPLSVLRND